MTENKITLLVPSVPSEWCRCKSLSHFSRFLIISSLFFLIEVIIHGFFPYYQGSLPNYTFSGVFYKSTSIADELTYISIITALLINYRARNFVQFFSLVNLNEGLLSGYEYDGNLIA